MNWEEDLAKDAAAAAASCAASTTTGLNVYQSESTDPSTVLEEAINAWVVKPSLANIGSVVAPAKEGDAVGAGLYNSYTQVIWASTTGVGCAMASCSGGSMVACEYSPAGNDGKSAWYVHGAQATRCPTGTKAKLGLCIVEGDSKNDLIAPIPEGKWSYQVYPKFIPDIMSTILMAAKARDAPGAEPSSTSSPAGSAMYESLPEESSSDAEQTASSLEMETSSGSTTDSSSETSTSALGGGWDVYSTEGSTTEASGETTSSLETETMSGSNDLYDDTSSGSEILDVASCSGSSATSSSDATTESSGETTSSDLGGGWDVTSTSGSAITDSTAASTESGASTESSSSSETTSSADTSSGSSSETTASSEDEEPGTVKPSSAHGSSFKNQELSPSSGSATPTADSTKQEETKQEESPKQEITSSDAGSTTAVSAKNQSSAAVAAGTVLSPAAIAGIIVLGVVAVAALAVFVSYRKNQQRQQDIMRDGGIQVI
ncbi:Adhesin-like protein [Phytophthora palmivora]|uniref:Adhesin-like protein n=1 Tax=Phytophthora palmivora TaxID=4796 RepID=A0A2P4Y2H4_9STRA|nr:Adhesin-like protein [Phytophthora palmivora]